MLFAVLALALAAPAPAAASPRVADRLGELGRWAEAHGAGAADAVLDEAAAYWFAGNKNGRALNGGGPALAAAIRLARAEALRGPVKRLPAALKRTFAPHYSGNALDKARWLVAAPSSPLGRLLARWPVKEGAVTLGEVIVFKTERAARSPLLFAHELVHVEQYRRLGIDGFAQRYSVARTSMEDEARLKARRVVPG